MEFDDLLDFIDETDKKLVANGTSSSKRERVLSRTVKMGEEFVELCNAVIGFNKDQRSEKQADYSFENLEGEFADVIITTLLLAKTVDVDVKKALLHKIEKINNRFEREESVD